MMTLSESAELEVRLSFAAEYIQRSENSGSFLLNPYNWTIHLQAISFLYTYSKESSRTSFYDTADRCFVPLLDRLFKYNGNLVLVCNEKANTTWNSLAAICCFKSNRMDQGKRLVNAVKNTLNGQKSILTLSQAHQAYPAIALLWSGEDPDMVRDIAHNINKRPIAIDPVDAWLMKISADIQRSRLDEDFNWLYKKNLQRLKDIADQFSKVNSASMNSLFAGMAQQAHIANGYFNPEIFELQKQLQVMDDSDLQGAFIHNKRNSKPRLDYVIQNALSFLQMVASTKEDWHSTQLECCL